MFPTRTQVMKEGNMYKEPFSKPAIIKRELRVEITNSLAPDCSIQRTTTIEENWVTNGYVLYHNARDSYRLRFTTRGGVRLDRIIQAGTRLIIEEGIYKSRKRRKEREINVIKYRVVGADWTWFGGQTKEEQLLEFLRGGADLAEILNEDCLVE